MQAQLAFTFTAPRTATVTVRAPYNPKICGQPEDTLLPTYRAEGKLRGGHKYCPDCDVIQARGPRLCHKCGDHFTPGCKVTRLCWSCYSENQRLSDDDL